jgi:hypothetical protein
MKKLILALWLISTLATGAAWAQPYAPNDAGVTNGAVDRMVSTNNFCISHFHWPRAVRPIRINDSPLGLLIIEQRIARARIQFRSSRWASTPQSL